MDILVRIFQTLIEEMHGLTGDYGIAIVLVTVMIRLLLIPLNVRGRRQMEKQQELGRAVEEIKVRYRNNEKKQNEQLQKLYQEKGTGLGGCLISFLQLPIMICLYNAIRLAAAAGTATVLLPWVSSLLMRDRTLIMPIATLVVQMLPQTYPYLRFFRELDLQKMSPVMMGMMLLANSMFVFVIPSGVGLYYLVSGLFSAGEQFVMNAMAVRRAQTHGA